jgi:hypothetical protein
MTNIAYVFTFRTRPVPYQVLLSDEEKKKRDSRIPRIGLVEPSRSPFLHIFQIRNDQSLISVTGLDLRSFNYLLNKFFPLFEWYSPYCITPDGLLRELLREVRDDAANRGHPRSLESYSCLGLVLCFTRTRGSMGVLQMLFGLTASVLGLWLNFGIKPLFKILLREPLEQSAFHLQRKSNSSLLGSTTCIQL